MMDHIRSKTSPSSHTLQPPPLPLLLQLCQPLIRFFLGGVLAGSTIFGSHAPFGLALVGCSGSGLDGFFALLGTCLGYMVFHSLEMGLRYVATALLIYSVSFAFYDIKLYDTKWFMPLIALLFNGITGFVYQSGLGWSSPLIILFTTELILTAGGVYFYRTAFSPWDKDEFQPLSNQELASILILVGCLFISLSHVTLLSSISVGRTLSALVVMAISSQSGLAMGASVGLATGLAMDLAVGVPGFYTVVYGFSGLITGLFHSRKKVTCACAYLLANGTMVLWLWTSGHQLDLLYDIFVASVLFLLLPNSLLAKLSFQTMQPQPPAPIPNTLYVQQHLRASAYAFRDLFDSLKLTLKPNRTNDNDNATIFNRTAMRVCRRCALRDSCWQRNYQATYNALNGALPSMVERGRGEATDFPPHFSNHCLQFPKFLETANEELTALLYRKQYRTRLQENRWAVCAQYDQLSQLLHQAANELSAELTPNLTLQGNVQHWLKENRINCICSLFYDPHGHLQLEFSGSDLSQLHSSETQSTLNKIVGTSLRFHGENHGPDSHTMVFTQLEPLAALLGVANQKKDGETVSGDGHVWFKTTNGTLFVILCDGMGSGEGAHKDSALALQMLEKFLRAGVGVDTALKTLHSALVLRCEEDGGFTTVDLLEIDLFTGNASLYKFGAAPSYLKKGQMVSRITGTSLPAGVSTSTATSADRTRLALSSGDTLVLLSDGITDQQEDSALRSLLATFNGEQPKELALQLLQSNAGHPDDRTALVVHLAKRT